MALLSAMVCLLTAASAKDTNLHGLLDILQQAFATSALQASPVSWSRILATRTDRTAATVTWTTAEQALQLFAKLPFALTNLCYLVSVEFQIAVCQTCPRLLKYSGSLHALITRHLCSVLVCGAGHSLIASVIDLEQWEQEGMLVSYGISQELDDLKHTYHGLPDFLTRVVEQEMTSRIPRALASAVSLQQWSIVYMPQVCVFAPRLCLF
jgi:hypothetical protein